MDVHGKGKFTKTQRTALSLKPERAAAELPRAFHFPATPLGFSSGGVYHFILSKIMPGLSYKCTREPLNK